MKLCSWMASWLEKNVAPRRLIGLPDASRPMVPRPHASMLSWALRSKMPLGKLRQNFDRIVAVVSEWVGGTPSTPALVGSLYHDSSVIHCTGATRALTVIQSTAAEGASAGIRR